MGFRKPRGRSVGLAVSILAVKDAIDFEVVAPVAEEDTVILGAKPNHRRRHSLQLFGRAFSGEDIPAQGLENLQCDRLLDAANIGLGLT